MWYLHSDGYETAFLNRNSSSRPHAPVITADLEAGIGMRVRATTTGPWRLRRAGAIPPSPNGREGSSRKRPGARLNKITPRRGRQGPVQSVSTCSLRGGPEEGAIRAAFVRASERGCSPRQAFSRQATAQRSPGRSHPDTTSTAPAVELVRFARPSTRAWIGRTHTSP